ncbi:hypothetical protein HYS92_01855 [Candidatus Daviesbacteria bacterium]|nr:hypothetical protein [Candidatus Daviesbacteria bacterium]
MTSKSKAALNRDNSWLLARLDFIWTKYFTEVPQTNKVFIKFGRNARLRLGSIRLDRKTKASYILITSMFKEQSIPQEVVDHTIGHELVHYAHGFSSNRPRLHKYPHSGGVVKKEMAERGMEYLYKAYKAWIKDYRKMLKKSYGF